MSELLSHGVNSQPGEYFVTICTNGHECLFGKIIDGKMYLNKRGNVVIKCWEEIPKHFPHIVLDEYIIMPNHIHGILVLHESVGTRHAVSLQERFRKPVPGSLSTIVRSFKSAVTKQIHEVHSTRDTPLWQPRYYDRIIRNEKELNNIRDYISNNVMIWAFDKENPEEIPLFLKDEK